MKDIWLLKVAYQFVIRGLVACKLVASNKKKCICLYNNRSLAFCWFFLKFAFFLSFPKTESAFLANLINWVQCHICYLYYCYSEIAQIDKKNEKLTKNRIKIRKLRRKKNEQKAYQTEWLSIFQQKFVRNRILQFELHYNGLRGVLFYQFILTPHWLSALSSAKSSW